MKRLLKKLQMKLTYTFRNNMWGFWMLLPSMAGVMLFRIIPLADVLKRSLINNVTKAYVGLQNYKDVVFNLSFRAAIKNTFLFLGICIPILLSLSMVLAYLLSQGQKKSGEKSDKKDRIKTVLLIPMAIPVASIVLVWKLLFCRYGIVDRVLSTFNGGVDYLNSKWALITLVLTYVWRNIGYDVVLWVAAFHSVDQSIYEAADMDGADRLQQFRYITWPCILPYGSVILILSMLNAFKAFREVYLIAGEYPNRNIYLIQHLFNNWLVDLQLDHLCAAAILVLIGVGVIALLFQKALNRDIYK